MILLTLVLIPVLPEHDKLSLLVTIHLGFWAPLVFFILTKKTKDEHKTSAFGSITNQLDRMSEIMEGHEDGKPFSWPLGTPKDLLKQHPSEFVIEKYSHLMQTKQRLDAVCLSNFGFLPKKFIENLEELHRTMGTNLSYANIDMKLKSAMYKVVKIDSLVSEMKKQIKEFQGKL